jgi:hypothetical protein
VKKVSEGGRSEERSCGVVVEMWRASGRQRASRVFADEGIAAEGSVEGGEETQDLPRVFKALGGGRK